MRLSRILTSHPTFAPRDTTHPPHRCILSNPRNHIHQPRLILHISHNCPIHSVHNPQIPSTHRHTLSHHLRAQPPNPSFPPNRHGTILHNPLGPTIRPTVPPAGILPLRRPLLSPLHPANLSPRPKPIQLSRRIPRRRKIPRRSPRLPLHSSGELSAFAC